MTSFVSKIFRPAIVLILAVVTLAAGALVVQARDGELRPEPAQAVGAHEQLMSAVNDVREADRLHYLVAEHDTAACMQEAGFEYWAPDLANGVPVESTLDERGTSSSEGFAALNHEYVQGLSETETVRYNTTLLGADGGDSLTIEDPYGGVLEVNLEGCLGEARTAVLSIDDLRVLKTSLFQLETLPFSAAEAVRNSPQVRGRGLEDVAEAPESLLDVEAAVQLSQRPEVLETWQDSRRDLLSALLAAAATLE